MADPLVLDLGYQAAAHVLGAVARADHGFAALDLEGRVLWSDDASPDLECMARIHEEMRAGLSPEGGDFDLGDRGRVCLRPIRRGTGEPIAWLLAWSPDEEGDGALARIVIDLIRQQISIRIRRRQSHRVWHVGRDNDACLAGCNRCQIDRLLRQQPHCIESGKWVRGAQFHAHHSAASRAISGVSRCAAS